MSEKPVVRLEDTGVVSGDGRVDMASVSKSGVNIDCILSVVGEGCVSGGDGV